MKKKLISFLPETKINLDLLKYDDVYFLDEKLIEDTNFLEKNWRNSINQFSSIDINGKKILELTQINEKANLWFYNKFRIFHTKRAAYYELSLVMELLNENDEFHIISSNLIKELFDNYQIKIINNEKKKKKKNYTSYSNYILVFIIRVIISKKTIPKKPINILHGYLTSETLVRSIKDVKKSAKTNPVWGYLAEKYENQFHFIEDIAFPNIYKKYKITKRRITKKYKNTFTNEYILFKGLLRPKILKKSKKTNLVISDNLEKIKSNIHEPTHKLILKGIIDNNKVNALYIYKHFSYQGFFSMLNSKSSVTTYGENLSQGKVILDAAKQKGIKTYAIQHGMISAYNMGYNFSLLEAKTKPMPDITFAWGKKWKNEMIEHGNYPEDLIKIVGQPRTDIINKIKNTYPVKKGQITFFSQPQPDKEEQIASAKDFIIAANHNHNLKFCIKMHPGEDADVYDKLIEDLKPLNLEIINDKDAYQVLAESELAMTCFSTIGSESVYFNIPLIIYDRKGKDIAGYIKNEIGYWAKNSVDLISLISQYKEDKLKSLDRDSYINKTAHKIDEKVNERIMKIIENDI